MSRSSISLSIIFICAGGIAWLRMAAAALIPVIASSRSLCLISNPLPRAIAGLPNSAVMVAFRLTLVSVPEGDDLADELAVAAGADGNVIKDTPSTSDKITLV